MASIVKIDCPSCGAAIDLDKDREFGFCSYCGTKIYTPNAVQRIKGTVNLDKSSEVSNYLLRAKRFEDAGRFLEAEEYYNKALDIDATIESAQLGIARCERHITEPNLFVHGIGFAKDAKLVIIVDGHKVGSFFAGGTFNAILSTGSHLVQVRLNGIKRKPVEVNINSKRTKINIVCSPSLRGPKVSVDHIIDG